MNNVAEFIEVRQQIESLAKEIETLIEQNTMTQSRTRLDETAALLTKLTALADNDVQEIAVGRLTRLLTKLATKVAMLETRKRVVKKPPVS
jgi:inorganic triphosphatase YgiF